MKTIQVWHNSRCSKSRAAVNYLKDKAIDFSIKEYLKETVSESELRDVLKKLAKNPSEIIRSKESLYKELGLKDASEEELLKAMVENPKLIERPIIIRENKAVIARPLEVIEEVL